MKNGRAGDWFLQFVKGIFIGAAFIMPGMSGGALAAVFGIYERLISFMAHITKDFKVNMLYFIPVGLGGVSGVILLSYAVSFLFKSYEVPVLLFFIGCILGTFPSLWKQAGKKGRSVDHVLIMVLSGVIGYICLRFGMNSFNGQMALNHGTWLLSGALIGLGILVPGLSPSNFLVYMGLFVPMINGLKSLDLTIILPVGIGGVICVVMFSKLIDLLFRKAYTGMFHVILGIVASSTVLIVPRDMNYFSMESLTCAVTCAAGVLLARRMSSIEEKYKPAIKKT